MASDNICIFCGEKMNAFRSMGITFAETYQVCCKKCLKEIKDLDEEEMCRRALVLGYAQQPEIITARLELITKAEEHRPVCLLCGAKMKFESIQYLDNSPIMDRLTSEGFEVLPAYCGSCGKYEFYKYDIVRKNPYTAYLIGKDTSK